MGGLIVSTREMALLARWFIAEGGTLEEFVDAIERPDRWQPEIHAALALDELGLDA